MCAEALPQTFPGASGCCAPSSTNSGLRVQAEEALLFSGGLASRRLPDPLCDGVRVADRTAPQQIANMSHHHVRFSWGAVVEGGDLRSLVPSRQRTGGWKVSPLGSSSRSMGCVFSDLIS